MLGKHVLTIVHRCISLIREGGTNLKEKPPTCRTRIKKNLSDTASLICLYVNLVQIQTHCINENHTTPCIKSQIIFPALRQMLTL